MSTGEIYRQSGPSSVACTWQATLSGFCASLVGIGIARFAYTPLLPAIIAAHWFPPSTAAYLGAANLAGYLGGALTARPLSRLLPVTHLLKLMMLVATAALLACAWPLGFVWFFLWRFASGLAGGVLMVLAAPTVLAQIPAQRRGLAGGIMFTGVGAGIAASGTLVPLLLGQGLRETWLGLGAIAATLTLIAWRGWPKDTTAAAPPQPLTAARPTGILRSLYVEYALNAAGLVPHMIFLVDFVARGLGRGLQVGSEYWVLFGIGALIGPLITGHLGDRIGFRAALRVAYLTEAITVIMPALGFGDAWLQLSSIVVGAFTPGIVPLALGYIQELLPHSSNEQKAAWSKATTCFAIMQAAAAYAMSFIFTRSGGNYQLLFVLGATALLLALCLDCFVSLAGVGERPSRGQSSLDPVSRPLATGQSD